VPGLSDSGRPFLTYYGSAERTELSYATFGNWVAKTANLLVEGLSLDEGDVVGVALPDHWQAVVVAFAAWRAGAVVARGPGDVAFVAEDALGSLDRTGVREVVALSLLPMGAGLARAYPGVVDYAEEIAAYGDRFDTDLSARVAPVDGADALAASLGLDASSRLLVDGGDLLLAALAASRVGAGIVCGTVSDGVRKSERVTHDYFDLP
jgi:uncharacterized protein (TIGR03089 family)